MSDAATSKDILEDLLRDLSHRPYVGPLQRWKLRIDLVTLGVLFVTMFVVVVLKFLGIILPWIALVGWVRR